jgi:hypothetical protein
MSRNPELDRLKAEQQSLFEQKQAAFQRFKDLQKRTNIYAIGLGRCSGRMQRPFLMATAQPFLFMA